VLYGPGLRMVQENGETIKSYFQNCQNIEIRNPRFGSGDFCY
jgi:hypothetical protein